MNDLEVAGIDEDSRAGHKLFGHPNESLNEHYGLTPAPGRSNSIREYALLWRIDCDPAAGLAWGTNWLYVIIHKDDLAVGVVERAVLTGANAYTSRYVDNTVGRTVKASPPAQILPPL